MANVYARVSKITNVVGRSSYLTDEERQEEIVLHETSMMYSWEEHAKYEREHQKTDVANNEALEVHVALPNALADDPARLETACMLLATRLVGKNHDYEYAVHWNHSRSNLHVHILFSERENRIDLEPKVYKKDIWQDKDTHKLAKAGAENAVLVHRKGEIQKDKEGNIKYQDDIFKPKDPRFKNKKWVQKKNEIVQKTLRDVGYDLDLTTKESPYLAQKKLYKGASQDYIEKAKEWNKAVKTYNTAVRTHIEIEPEKEPIYREIKTELETKVKEANSESKKITEKAIDLIKDMGAWAQNMVMQLQIQINAIVRENELRKKWDETKEKFIELFERRQEIQRKRGNVETDLHLLQNVKSDVEMVIKQDRQTIDTIEKSIRQKEELEKRRKQEAEKKRLLGSWYRPDPYSIDYNSSLRNEQKHEHKERKHDYGIER